LYWSEVAVDDGLVESEEVEFGLDQEEDQDEWKDQVWWRHCRKEEVGTIEIGWGK